LRSPGDWVTHTARDNVRSHRTDSLVVVAEIVALLALPIVVGLWVEPGTAPNDSRSPCDQRRGVGVGGLGCSFAGTSEAAPRPRSVRPSRGRGGRGCKAEDERGWPRRAGPRHLATLDAAISGAVPPKEHPKPPEAGDRVACAHSDLDHRLVSR